MTRIDRRPSRVAAAAAGLAAVVAATTSATSTVGLGLGIAGTVAVALGVIRGSRRAVDVGGLALFLGVVANGLIVDVVETAVVGTVAAVVAWDLGQGAIDLGAQVGRDAPSVRLETVHVVSSLLVGLGAATIGYAVYIVGSSGPSAAVAVLLLAACLVTVGLGSRGS